MPLLSAAADTFILGAVVSLIAFAYRGSIPAPAKNMRQPKYWPLITGLLAIHTLYMIHTISFKTPPNLFTELHLPLSMPSHKIRATLLARTGISGDDVLPEHIEDLLTRLNTYDLRTYFVRFGQNTVQECEWCTTFTEYAVYTIAPIFLSYILEAALLGLVTIRGSNREMWRSTTIGVLILACSVDAYWMLTVRVTVDQQDVTMWYDTLWILRHALFTALPLVTHFVFPPSFTPSPLAIVPQTNLTLQALHRRLQLLKFTSAITLRVPEFRQAAGNYWETQRMEGKWAREDEGINRFSDKTGRGIKREVARELALKCKHGLDI
ncbi:hypothetical protein BJ322DRAFT_609118 [Thelephora terrestris]|uniref:Uncharacterized protein n=1 Tax=Thelephora terrestris TaxID=56493 RepID=A0A9P6HIP7_9AGAM|nr:hypothetical protein BJ322DRAFT_609118 [Thelephora terrestris]